MKDIRRVDTLTGFTHEVDKAYGGFVEALHALNGTEQEVEDYLFIIRLADGVLHFLGTEDLAVELKYTIDTLMVKAKEKRGS